MASWWRKALNTAKDIGLPVLGGIVGGPLGGALAGALAGATGRGKPRLKNILVGAGTGALTGGAIKKAGGGMQGFKNMFTGGASSTSTSGATQAVESLVPETASQIVQDPLKKSLIGRGLEWVEKNPLPAQAIATGLQSMTSRDSDAELMDLRRDIFNEDKAQYAKEEERRRKIAQLLFPIYQQMYERQRGAM